MSMDNRAIVHIAGKSFYEQYCTRCHTLLYSRNQDGNPWPSGAMIANHGHGGWSVVASIDPIKDRLCYTKEAIRHA